GDWITVPIAHAEGRFVTSDEILSALVDNDQTAFRYCDEQGNIINEFPVNPNGSRYNLAAVSNPAGNVMAIMPHPERTPGGDAIFTSMRDYIETRPVFSYRQLPLSPPAWEIDHYRKAPGTLELTVELIITDNTAASVHNALTHRNIPVQVRRRVHWEIQHEATDPGHLLEKIAASGELFNSNKERIVAVEPAEHATTLLVRNRADVRGQQKLEALSRRFGLSSITAVKYGVLWTVTPLTVEPEAVLLQVLDTHILFNPIAHQCYHYEQN
ncbi:MAG: phosphoribosylformylglycinamidine synthase subunit PurQ, partial [Candidatus Neomarinimicrobiota bacterium]